MEKVTKEVAEKKLEPHATKIQGCILMGINEYQTEYSKYHYLHSARSRASLVRDHIVEKIKQAFDGNKGVNIIDKRGLFLLSIDGFVIRFKKLNKNFKTSNIQTQQTLRFSNQLEIEGLYKPITNLNAGYIANEFWSDFECLITCPNGNRLDWVINIPKKVSTTPIITISTQRTHIKEPLRRVRPRIRKSQSNE
jgi:hypothetical protein